MNPQESGLFSKQVSRRTMLQITCGGAIAFSFFPRVAFASRNSLVAIRTGVQPGDKTRFVIETSARPSHTISYPKADDGRHLIRVELNNTAGNSSVKPVYGANTLVKTIEQNQVGNNLHITANLRRRVREDVKPSIMILEPNGDAKFRLVIDFTMAGGAATGAGAAAAKPTTPAPKPAAKKKRVIVVDAGHGGRDPGAIGRGGVREKDVVLSVARRLRTKLASAGYTVHLTRDKDIFLNLNTRADMAERHRADLFISLHANANPSRNMKGFSVYTLSKKASDEEARKLAELENAVDKIEVDGFAKFEADVRNALSALQQAAVTAASVEFASITVKSFRSHGITQQPNAAMRSAPFAVLRSTIPSALIELGHLSNAEEEKLLNSDSHQQKLVNAITKAINDYDFED
ncbi:MAG: N-acetylmuramoyl-L-alanine amidase [Alphaproteobacteria bacterium]|nr:N-acetylmuramoyl-L-alanine amidase [Alphaproteobacteria bacterium]MCL2890131.1 N-acetylmuramoyl-L-alanine amidase [Alphaproteobacteria bacterium]